MRPACSGAQLAKPHESRAHGHGWGDQWTVALSHFEKLFFFNIVDFSFVCFLNDR